MSRSFFRSTSSNSGDRDRDRSPLLPIHEPPSSVRLQDLSPRPSISESSRAASPSPPPSFYRDHNVSTGAYTDGSRSPQPARRYADQQSYAETTSSLSSSPSRTRAKRIQFAAPPPPIVVGSVMLSPHDGLSRQGSTSRERALGPRRGSRNSTRSGVDPLLILERRERALQGDLQMLLDAQSLGLIQGLGAGAEGGSEGSATPTGSRSGKSSRDASAGGGIVPVRQPKRKPISLRGARRGVLGVMGELAGVKVEEVTVLDYEIARREEVLKRIGLWERRIETVREQLEGANTTPKGKEPGEDVLEDLQSESLALGSRIQELEDTLLQLRARQSWLDERITEGINKREARLSSYRGALKEVEGEVKEFLKRPPIQSSAIILADEAAQSFLALKPERRTLGMAREWWTSEASALKAKKRDVEIERDALEEGGVTWSECIEKVNTFENELRREMKSGAVQGPQSLRAQIGKMDGVMKFLGARLGMCEEKGWKLLVCAVGAELEAFKEGKKMLEGVLEEVDPQPHHDHDHDPFGNGDGDSSKDDDGGNRLMGLDGGLDGGVENQRQQAESEASEDEGPDLASLMVDRGHDHDDDTS